MTVEVLRVPFPKLLLPALLVFSLPFFPLPPWALMWSMAIGVFLFCKFLSWPDSALHSQPAAARFFLLWPGMDPRPFLAPIPAGSATVSGMEWLGGAVKTLGGVLFLAIATGADRHGHWLTPWLGLAGLGLVLHFGLFHPPGPEMASPGSAGEAIDALARLVEVVGGFLGTALECGRSLWPLRESRISEVTI